MWNMAMYARLDRADAWAIIGPVNWYAPTANLKLMFDRLVCMNGGNRRDDRIEHAHYFDPERDPADQRETYAPLVWQCRFSGIEVPEALWHYESFGAGRIYSHNQAEDMVQDDAFMNAFDAWIDAFAAFVGYKGKVKPGRYRAYGYTDSSRRWADAKLKWREIRMATGLAPSGSSPRQQDDPGVNQDVVRAPKKSEGERLRGR